MKRLTCVDDFKVLRDLLHAQRNDGAVTIVIPAGTCGIASGAGRLIQEDRKSVV